MVGWHHWLNGHGFGWTLRVGDGQGGLACCSLWGRKELDTTQRLKWTELKHLLISGFNPLCWNSKRIKEGSESVSSSVMSNSLQSHGLQHPRPPCPLPTPGVYSNSCPLSQWCHPTISCPVISFSSCLQSFPASGSFQMSQIFASDGQSIGVSTSTSVLPMNIQDWFPLGWTGWISLPSKGLSRVFSNTTVQKHQFSGTQLSL